MSLRRAWACFGFAISLAACAVVDSAPEQLGGEGGGGGSLSGQGAVGPTSACGDGIQGRAEGCDDGNLSDGDGCGSSCAVEEGWACQMTAQQGSYCIRVWEVEWMVWVDAVVQSLPGPDTQGFVVPDESERAIFSEAVDAALTGDWQNCDERAAQIDYQYVKVIDVQDDSAVSFALLPKSWTPQQNSTVDGRGVFVLREADTSGKPLAVSAPHPRFDQLTGLVAALTYQQLGAFSFALAGTHRCANELASGCSGSTSVCTGSSEPYRESDMAHIERSFFQVFHERIDDRYRDTIQHLQVHGMSSTATTPEFSISDGTTTNIDDDDHPSNRLAIALESLTQAAGSTKLGNSCNRPGDINHLCASSNTQGRYSNGVDAASTCMTSSGGQSSGRFVHAELSRAIRDKDEALGPQLFVDAVAAAFGVPP